MKKQHFIYSILILLTVFFSTIFAQDGGQPGAFLRLGAGVRADAFGGAYTAVANDASAGYWNPAGLAQIKQAELIASYYKMSLDRNFNFISAATPFQQNGSIGISWIGISVDGLEARSSNTAEPDFVFANQENALLLTYGHRINSHFAIGLNGKVILQKLAAENSTGFGFDAAFLYQPLPSLHIGLNLQNIGASTTWSNNYQEKIPFITRAGVAVNLTENFLLSTDIFKIQDTETDFAFGFEYTIWKMLPLRMGFHEGTFGGGLGFVMPMPTMNLSFDYAMGTDPIDQAASHKFSLSILLHGHKRPQLETAVSQRLYAHLPEDAPRVKKVESKQSPEPAKKNGFFDEGDFADTGQNNMPDAESFIAAWQPTSSTPKTSAPVIQQSHHFYTSTVAKLNVRSGPGTKFKRVGVIRKGQKIKLVGQNGKWLKIQVSPKRVGWVYDQYMQELAE